MARFRVPDGSLGFELADGTKYDPNREGWVEVEREDHARAIRKSSAMRSFMGGGLILEGYRFVGAAGWDCVCGFSAFDWQSRCPKCGAQRPAEVMA